MVLAVEQVYDELDADLRRFIRRRVRDPETAEDLLQDVYLKIHTRVGDLRDEERLQAWVYRVARNAIADHYRAKRPTEELGDVPYLPDDPVDAEAAERLSRSVRLFLDTLPPPYREALVRTEDEGLTQVQLARRLGISVSGAKSRVQRARARLKALLLACCHFELDRAGRVIDYQPRAECCVACGSGSDDGCA